MLSFTDRSVTFSFFKFVTALCALAGLGCAVFAAVLLVQEGQVALTFAVLSVPLIGLAAVLRIRSFFATLCHQWTEAFEHGREVGAESRQGVVKPLR